jgi:hypothetical protein
MNDSVALKPSLVSVVKHIATESLRIDPQVANAEAFEKKTERAQVVDEVLRGTGT